MAMGLKLAPHNSVGESAYPAQPLMPHVEDYTHMWWAEGFPSHTPDSPWMRCIQTGYYAMALNTQTLQLPHFGEVQKGLSYYACAVSDNHAVSNLPPAKLELSIRANGKIYHCQEGGKWTSFTGPRLIESGRFMQRADVTDLVFISDDGSRLNIDARFETASWPDRLGLIFAALPGLLPIPAGETCFGRIGGGYGLDGTNHLEIPPSPELDLEQFTLEFWVYVPTDYQVTETFPWLVCMNSNEEADGNYGIVILNDNLQARMNIGGNRANEYAVDAGAGHSLKIEGWNHLALSYDGDTRRFYVSGDISGEKKIGRKRIAGHGDLTFILYFDGKLVNQNIHGNDFWQTDYDTVSRSWSRTYNPPINDDKEHHIKARKST